MSHPLLNEWLTNSTVLRVVGGTHGLGFDTLCLIRKLSEDKMLLAWEDGDSNISLEDATFEYHELTEASPERRMSEEAEWMRQLIIRWPSHPERLCLLFEQRKPS